MVATYKIALELAEPEADVKDHRMCQSKEETQLDMMAKVEYDDFQADTSDRAPVASSSRSANEGRTQGKFAGLLKG